jgi:hypothetical protein
MQGKCDKCPFLDGPRPASCLACECSWVDFDNRIRCSPQCDRLIKSTAPPEWCPKPDAKKGEPDASP